MRSNIKTINVFPRSLRSFKMEFMTKKGTGSTYPNRASEKRVLCRGEDSGRPAKISSVLIKEVRTERGPNTSVGLSKKSDAKLLTMRDNKITISKERQKMSKRQLLPKELPSLGQLTLNNL